MKKLITLFCIAILLISVNAFGATQNIYLDNAGAGAGSEGDPYGAFSEINWTTGGANSIFDWIAASHDVVINLKDDATWREQFTVGTFGVVDHPITIGAYGSGAKPIISGASQISSWIYGDASADDLVDLEENDLTDFNGTTIPAGQTLEASSTLKRQNYGLHIGIANTGQVFGITNTVSLSTQANFGFDINISGLTMANGDQFTIAQARCSGTNWFLLNLRRSGANYQVAIILGDATTGFYNIYKSEWNRIEYQMVFDSGVEDNGEQKFYVNYELKETDSNIDNDTKALDFVRIGAPAFLDIGTTGDIYYDNICSHHSYIGYSAYRGAQNNTVYGANDGTNYWTKANALSDLTTRRDDQLFSYLDAGNNLLYLNGPNDDEPGTIEVAERIGINISEESYITIQDIEIKDARRGIYESDSGPAADNIIIDSIIVYNCGYYGILFYEGTNITVKKSTTYDNGRYEGGSGITLYGVTTGSVYENYSYSNGGYDDEKYDVPEGYDSWGAQIEMAGGSSGIDIYFNKIYQDLAWCNVDTGVDVEGGCSSINVYNNLINGSGRAVNIYTSTVNVYNNALLNYDATSREGHWENGVAVFGSSSNVKIKNNIFYTNSTLTTGIKKAGIYIDDDSTTGFESDYNLFYQPNATDRYGQAESTLKSWVEWQALGYDANSPTPTNPLFTDAPNDIFTLKPGSPCRHGATYLSGYETKLRPEASWPSSVTIMEDILSIGAYGIYRGSAGM